MIDIALVSYINTRPFMDGFEAKIKDREIRFHLLPPVDCATHLHQGKCQMALLPVGALAQFKNISIMPNYCIGADGEVASVFLFSQEPLEKLDTIYLDRHSRSSNGLLQILMKHHWEKEVSYHKPEFKHFDKIKGSAGGVVIGDKAIRIRDQYAYAYDLAQAWKDMTGLPFAFAVWAYLPEAFTSEQLRQLNDAMRFGVEQAPKSAAKWAPEYKLDPEFAHKYLSHYIDFQFDVGKHKALELYYQLLLDLPQPELQLV